MDVRKWIKRLDGISSPGVESVGMSNHGARTLWFAMDRHGSTLVTAWTPGKLEQRLLARS